ncbi:TonB-dependent receptor [Parasphingopyxis lamellibrachiae]|uniref:Outer membrane receptor protein involved in Fe transport n=1 Tax=Parasphingopyxis lamellibrachiae TaxID=680125 RepID=A0A3D9FJ11_9SPHN|nr:TonB-dependent receptor [Parasphingopyxis lamellibrachiae]RED17789.1 outer membrane receptor protein involved in Fe transport [Parasphingopyxis lamellibrachiae]
MQTVTRILLAGTALAAPGIAQAQTTAEEQSGGLNVIVVTAQSREEGLSDVPISIATVSGDQLESYGTNSLEDAASAVPNLNITQTAIANRIAIRGIASGDNKGFEQSVAMFVDNIYYGRDQLSRMPLVDLERVEVLRGPQPTLFGKNAIAGALNIVTRDPSDEFEMSLSALYEFEHDETKITGVVSGPITDSIGARLVGYYRDMDGYILNTNLGRDEPNARDYYMRGIVDYESDGFRLELKGEYADFRSRGQARENFGPVGTYSLIFQGPLAVDTDLDWRREDNGYQSDNETISLVANAELDLGGVTLTSVTGYLEYSVDETIDVDFTAISLLDGTQQSEDYSQFSQEVRVTSPGNEPFNYIAGIYYQHSELDAGDRVRFNPTFLGFGPPFSAIGDTINVRDYSQESDLFSVFAQGEISLTDRLRLTAGARYNHENKSGDRTLGIVQGPLNASPAPVVAAVFRALNIEAHTISGEFTENSLNPMVNVQYDATDELMLYASYARGTKAGGFDIRSNSVPGSPTVARPGSFRFEEESANNFEVGLKYESRTAAINLSFFRTSYSDLQTNVFDGTLNFNVRNASGARTQGIEADARVAVGDHLVLSGAISYLDFEFTNFDQGQCYFGQVPDVAGGFCSYNGQRNALTPEWSGNLNADFSHPLGNTLELGVNFNADFSSNYIAASNLDPNTRQEGFVKLGARISVGDIDDRWSIALIGRNLTNERILTTAGALPLATTITGGTGIAYNGIFERPRSIALAVDFNF